MRYSLYSVVRLCEWLLQTNCASPELLNWLQQKSEGLSSSLINLTIYFMRLLAKHGFIALYSIKLGIARILESYEISVLLMWDKEVCLDSFDY